MPKLLLSTLLLSMWLGFTSPSTQASSCTLSHEDRCLEKSQIAVTVDSTPAANNGVLQTELGQTIDFKRTVSGSSNYGWSWSYDSSKLSCAGYPEFDSSIFRCKVIGRGQSRVSISVYDAEDTSATVQSNIITVTTGEKSPLKVTLSSTPTASNGSLHMDGVVQTELGQTIDFKRTVSGSNNYGWSWSYDSSKLSCEGYPSFDSSIFRCKVIAKGQSNVSISIYDSEDTSTTVQSNIITVTTEAKAPAAGYEDEVEVNISSYSNPFSDTDLQTLAGQAASELYRRGVIGGFPDGEFKGDRAVNRAEAAKFLILARYGKASETQNNGKFSDVKDGEWYTSFVMNAANLGIIQGYPDKEFKPQNGVNTAEFIKMLTLTFGLETNLKYSYTDVHTNDWFAPYAGVAEKYKLFPERGTKLNPSTLLTRDEVSIAIYQYLKNR